MFNWLFKKENKNSFELETNEKQKLIKEYDMLISQLKLCKQDSTKKMEIANIERLKGKLLV